MEGVAYAEIWEILEQLEAQERNKIPKEILENINNKRDKEYNANIDLNIPLKEQTLSQKATELLCYLEVEFLSTPEQKEKLLEKYKENEERMAKEYDVSKIFEKRKQEIVLPIVAIKQEKWYKKIWDKIKEIFNI